MLNKAKFVQYSAILAAAVLVVVAYLAFVRQPNNDASYASNQNGQFLGLKGSVAANNELENQEELSVDGDFGGTSVMVDDSANESTVTTDTDEVVMEPTDESTPAENNNVVSTSDKAASLYTVKEGDTYGCIAEKYYGSYEHWSDIYNANARYGVGYSPDRLFVDAVLELPAISASDLKPASNLCQ